MTTNIKEAWSFFKHNFWKLALVNIIFSTIYLGVDYLANYLSRVIGVKEIYIGIGGAIDSGFFISPVLSFFVLLVFPIFVFIFTKILFEIVDNKEGLRFDYNFFKKISFKLKTYLNLLVSFIVLPIIIISGLILFIVPGFYLVGRLFPVCYLIIDKNLSFFQALKESWKTTKGIGWKMVWRLLIIGLIALIPSFLKLAVLLLTKIPFSESSSWVLAGLFGVSLSLLLIPLIASYFIYPMVSLIMVKLFREIEDFEIKEVKEEKRINPELLEKKEKPNYLDNIIKQ